MITNSKETDRLLSEWITLRQQLETSETPLQDVTNFFIEKPKVKIYTDPYDQSTWPTPWELIVENQFCPVNILLGIAYTYQLTERFKDIKPTLAIAFDINSKAVYYLLSIDNQVFGYLDNEWIISQNLPKSLITQKIFNLTPVH